MRRPVFFMPVDGRVQVEVGIPYAGGRLVQPKVGISYAGAQACSTPIPTHKTIGWAVH